jgi:hypothetical protein
MRQASCFVDPLCSTMFVTLAESELGGRSWCGAACCTVGPGRGGPAAHPRRGEAAGEGAPRVPRRAARGAVRSGQAGVVGAPPRLLGGAGYRCCRRAIVVVQNHVSPIWHCRANTDKRRASGRRRSVWSAASQARLIHHGGAGLWGGGADRRAADSDDGRQVRHDPGLLSRKRDGDGCGCRRRGGDPSRPRRVP